jgi:tRNA1Val (adenine37-N6)-methyltransferase
MSRRTLLGTKLWIEQTSRHAFNLDTILLSDFIKVPYKSKLILDLGTGAGAIMLYVSQKTKTKIIGVEVQASRYEQALNNIKINHLEHQLSAVHQDLKTITYREVDCIISNPPFFKITETSNLNLNEEEMIARHEVMMSLEDLIQISSKALRFAGHFFMIHRPDRFAETNDLMKKYQLEIKRVRFVHPYLTAQPNHVLIEAVRGGQPGMKVEPPLILYTEKQILTEEMQLIYGGRSYVTQPT